MALASSRKNFDATLPSLINDIASYVSATGASSKIVEYITHAMELNAPKGRLSRGLMVPETGLILLNRQLTSKEFHDLSILGWLVEFLSGSLLILDDIMDGSTTRRDEPCWYLQPNVGMLAINDASLLRSAIFLLVRKHFHEHPAYLGILEIFHEVGFLTELGQEADGLASQQVDLGKWDMKQYEFIITNKTSNYSFYLPNVLALHYLGLATPRNTRQARDILVVIGKRYHM